MSEDHARRIDRFYRYQRHIYDFTRPLYLWGRNRLLRDMAAGFVQGGGTAPRVLEVGCGTGRNLRWLARKAPTAKLFALDASEQMLATANAAIARDGLRERIQIRRGFVESFDPRGAFSFPPEDDALFDHVFYSYSLTMIPDPIAALERGLTWLRPGGTLNVVDFCDLGGGLQGSAFTGWFKMFNVHPNPKILAWCQQHHPFTLRYGPLRYGFLARMSKN